MKLFGRTPERYILGLKRLPLFLRASWRAFDIFENPIRIIWLYIVRGSHSQGPVRLRSGHSIHLSSDPADIVTVFLIFAQEAYGKISPGVTVIDIGANIGVFALFAAISGAKEVRAFEPSAVSYQILLKNIETNRFGSIIRASRSAVVGAPRGPVKFPRASDVLNSILPDSTDSADYDLVPSIALSEILSPFKSVDLLKSDCEGGEYDIFLNAPKTDIQKIREIRMEYHRGPREQLVARLATLGFSAREYATELEEGYLLSVADSSAPVKS